jgi:hypothetical protein
MADGNLLGCGLDTKEELPRLITRPSDDILNSVAVVNVGWNPLNGSNLLRVWQNESRQVTIKTILADNFDGHLGKVLECHRVERVVRPNAAHHARASSHVACMGLILIMASVEA